MINFEKTEADIRREARRGKLEEATRYGIVGTGLFLLVVMAFPFLMNFLVWVIAG